MGAKTAAIGSGVAMVLAAFVNHVKAYGFKNALQALLQLLGGGGVVAHGVVCLLLLSSPVR